MSVEPSVPGTGLAAGLGVVVFLVMAAAVFYAAWIGVINFSRIHV